MDEWGDFALKGHQRIALTSMNGLKDHQSVSPGHRHGVDKRRTSTGQVQDKFHTDNPNIVKLVHVVGYNELSVKGMMEGVGLKGRDNFLNLYLTPAIAAGYIRLLYPQSPRHPRQKYLLTVKGQMLYDIIMKKGGEG